MLIAHDVADSICKSIELAPHVGRVAPVDAPDVNVNITARALAQAAARDCRLDALA